MSKNEQKTEVKKVEGATKFSASLFDEQDDYGIDSILKKELEDQGLEWRFIDFKQARLNGGRSRAGWIIYKRQSEDPRLQGIASLADPDGLVRNGSLVLAVKTKAAADRQRKRRDEQNRMLSRYTQHVTQELDGDAKKLGGSSRIIAGYDKNS